MKKIKNFLKLASLADCLLVLSSCGGGGGTPATSNLSGVAAVGTPIANGNISVICASGNALAPTTTNSSGAWSVTLTGQTPPCAVQVSSGTINGASNTTPYHSIATITGTVNVTPFTDLLVANLVGTATPGTWFSGLSTTPAPLNNINQAAVTTALTNMSTAMSGLPQLGSVNPITKDFTPTSGNLSDDMLTALAIAMTNTSTPYTTLQSNASSTPYTLPAGFNTALATAFAGTPSGSVSISATANTTAQSLTVGTAMTSFTPLTGAGGAIPYIYSYAGILPPGLNFNTSTGAVTGTPTATYATANLVFSVQDANGVVANTTSTVSFTVGAASDNLSATANTTAQSLTVGTAMASFSPLTPSGGATPYTYSYTGTLPAGLSFNTSTGAVTGTPSATYTTANLVFSVKDANNVVASTTSTVSFTVVAAPVSISATANTTTQNLTVGTAMASFSPLTPSGGATPYTYSYTGTLPAGLSFNTSTGAVTGTPSATYTTANLVFSVKDANNVVASTTSTVSFTVVAAQVGISATATTTAQSLTVGTAMTSFTPLTGTGGAIPYIYSYAGTLPSGLSFNTSTGAVTGTPSATYATANLVFSVQDAKGVVANTTSTVSFTVGAASVSISATANTTAQSLTVGTAMASFSPLTPSGGATPYTYSYTGTLPAGLSFNTSTGAVTGTPSATYTTANLVFSVKDANNVVASTTSTVSFTVVAAPVSISATANTTTQNLTVGTAMASFSPLTPSGGATPYTYSYTGTLPAGLSFNTSTGAVTGTPSATYTTANLVFSVKDANNVVASTTSTVSFTVVAAPVSISATATTTAQNLTDGTAMTSFKPLTPSGGATPYTYSYTGTLPAGLSLNTSTGAVTGTPSATYTTANVVFSVKDTNNVVASTTSTVSFNVVPATPTGLAFVEGALTANPNINIAPGLTADAYTADWFVQWDSATPPAAGAGGWSTTKPTAGTVPSYGNHTLYVYTKDALGNVSAPASRSIVYDLAPTIPSIPSLPAGISGGTTVHYSVTFADEQAWGGASAISITANNGATITGGPFGGSYGAKTFGITPPAWTGSPVTITITYSVTDSNGVTTTATDTVDNTP